MNNTFNNYIKNLKNKKFNDKNISSFLSDLYKFRQECGINSNNKTTQFFNKHILINNIEKINFIKFKLRYIMIEYINKCNFKKLKELLIKLNKSNFSEIFKNYVSQIYYSILYDEILSSKCNIEKYKKGLKEIFYALNNLTKIPNNTPEKLNIQTETPNNNNLQWLK